jgi:phosphoribosyl 1,2-cyclic phosphodiesterase
MGFLYSPSEVFEDCFELAPGLCIRPLLQSHDEMGVAAFRIEVGSPRHALGFATDLGRASEELVRHLSGVDVLAIESNYCPRMQLESPRPEFLKRRIMGGAGHLSNRECAEAARLINPARHVVLLHLSTQCNTPTLAAAEHQDRRYGLTLSRPDAPTPWITIASGVPAIA